MENRSLSICVLLNGAIANDSRVIKTVRTLSSIANVDLFYINGEEYDYRKFNKNVRLFPCEKPESLKLKIIRHSCFYNEYLFYIKEVVKLGITYDFIWANDLPCLKPAVILKRKMGAKLVYDSHEIYLETLNQFFPFNAVGVKKYIFWSIRKLMYYLGLHAEKHYVNEIDEFITVNNSIKDFFENKYNVKNVRVLYNYPCISRRNDTIDLHKELGLINNEKILIYQGGLQNGRGLKLLVDTFKFVNSNIVLLILGSGNLKRELEKLTLINNLEKRIFFKDYVDMNVLLSYTRGADFGINLLEPINLNTKLALPNKIFEYIHANIPVIASNMVEIKKIFNKYKLGILVELDSQKIARAINTLATIDSSVFKDNCKKAVLEYNWENQEDALIDMII